METQDHKENGFTIRPSSTSSNINKESSVDRPLLAGKVKDAYFAYRTDKEILPDKKDKKAETKYEYTFYKLDRSIVSKKLYVIVKTEGLKDKKIKVSICSAKEKVLNDVDAAIKLLYESDELSEKELQVNNYFDNDSISNKGEFKNQTIFEVTLKPKEDKDTKTWKDTIYKSTDKKASLYIKVETDEDGVVYEGKGTDNKCFLYEQPFELYSCYCDRDMSEQEVKDMVALLGKTKSLFDGLYSQIKAEDKTYKKLADELNAVFKKYEINTCNRKAHFIAQIYHESAYFGTATEGGAGKQYELANWEQRVKDLQTNIDDITTLVPEVNKILTTVQAAALDETKSQIQEITSKISTDTTLTKEQKETIDKYKAIFAKEWQEQLDQTQSKIKYNTKGEYVIAKDGKKDKPKKSGAVDQVATIKAHKNTKTGDGSRYKGKGLIQITWRDTYEGYFTYIKNATPIPEAIKNKTIDDILNRKDDDMSQLLAKELFYAVDSAGWFWKEFKKINDKADYDGDTIVSYTVGGTVMQIANINRLTRMINGGINGLQNRTDNYNTLKNNFFLIKSTCINVDKIK